MPRWLHSRFCGGKEARQKDLQEAPSAAMSVTPAQGRKNTAERTLVLARDQPRAWSQELFSCERDSVQRRDRRPPTKVQHKPPAHRGNTWAFYLGRQSSSVITRDTKQRRRSGEVGPGGGGGQHSPGQEGPPWGAGFPPGRPGGL